MKSLLPVARSNSLVQSLFTKTVRCFALIMMMILLSGMMAMAADRYSVASGNWNATSTWSATDQGSSGASVPVAGDVVYITRGWTVTVNISNAACTSLTLGKAGTSVATGTLTFASTGNPSITVSGATVIGGSSTNNGSIGTIIFTNGSSMSSGSLQLGGTNGGNTGTITMTAGGTLTVGGAITIGADGGTWTPGTGTVIMTANNTLPATIFTTFYNLTINGGTTTLSSSKTILNGGTLSLTNGTFAAGTNLTMASTTTINRSEGIMTGTPQGTGIYNVNYTGNSKSTGGELAGSGLNNVTVNLTAANTTLTSSATAFSVDNNLTVTQGNLILQATDANYTVTNDLTIAANGTLTHSVNWDGTSRLLAVGGNISIDGIFDYTTRSHVQMTSTGTKTIRTGSNPASSFSILTLTTGTFNASGTLKVDDNFWAMFNTAGSFHTYGQTVTANAGVLNSGGAFYIDGGTLNVTAGLTVGAGSNGNVVLSAGTLNADAINVGNGTATGTFTQSGGTSNVSGSILINPSCTFTCTNSPAINLSGNFTNNGTYTKATETVTLNGADQTIGGSAASNFYNLALAGSGTKTFGAARTITGNLSISTGVKAYLGTFTSLANTLTLGGSGAAGGSWGSTGSPADNINDTYFYTGTGILNTTAGSCATVTASVAGQTNITCFDAHDGTITVTASGGQSPYTFSVKEPAEWQPATSGNTSLFTGLYPNVPYLLRVKDANNCPSFINP